jgi:hypothetical protein
MSYTAQAQIEQKVVEFHFPTLKEFYNPDLGNFQFTKRELEINIVAITRWLDTFNEYSIICQKHKENEGQDFFLTDWYE